MSGNSALIAVALAAALTTAPPALDEESFARWRDTIRPAKEELRWQEVPWRASFWEGVIEAQKQERPILVWAMNGHPLACT
jgi:hypothetical protein